MPTCHFCNPLRPIINVFNNSTWLYYNKNKKEFLRGLQICNNQIREEAHRLEFGVHVDPLALSFFFFAGYSQGQGAR